MKACCNIIHPEYNLSYLGNRSSRFFSRFFEKNPIRGSDFEINKNSDEPPPPGVDRHNLPLEKFGQIKVRPSKLGENVQMIGKYVSLAIFRQRLHADVLKDLIDSLFSESFYRHCLSWMASRKIFNDVRSIFLCLCHFHLTPIFFLFGV